MIRLHFPQEFQMPIHRGSFYNAETVTVQEHFEGVALCGPRVVEVEELKEVRVVEVLHEVLLVLFRVRFQGLSCRLGGLDGLEIDASLIDLPAINLFFDSSNGH